MTTHKNHKTVSPTFVEQNGEETPNKVIVQVEEKTWDGPLGEAVRNGGTGQGYTQPEAIPRPETEETGNQKPLPQRSKTSNTRANRYSTTRCCPF